MAILVAISLSSHFMICCFIAILNYSSSFDVDDGVGVFDESRPQHDWAKLTVAFSKLRQVVNRCCGGSGSAVRAFTSPSPRPRLQPVIKIDFILPRVVLCLLLLWLLVASRKSNRLFVLEIKQQMRTIKCKVLKVLQLTLAAQLVAMNDYVVNNYVYHDGVFLFPHFFLYTLLLVD